MKYVYLIIVTLCFVILIGDIHNGNRGDWLVDLGTLAGWATAFLLQVELDGRKSDE